MTQENLDTLFQVVTVLVETASFAKNNPAVKTPITTGEYFTLSEELMDIIRDVYKEVEEMPGFEGTREDLAKISIN